jgi:hypothetical protein
MAIFRKFLFLVTVAIFKKKKLKLQNKNPWSHICLWEKKTRLHWSLHKFIKKILLLYEGHNIAELLLKFNKSIKKYSIVWIPWHSWNITKVQSINQSINLLYDSSFILSRKIESQFFFLIKKRKTQFHSIWIS